MARGVMVKRYHRQIHGFQARERGSNAADAEKARLGTDQIETEGLLEKANKAMTEPGNLLDRAKKEWESTGRARHRILCSPAITISVSMSVRNV